LCASVTSTDAHFNRAGNDWPPTVDDEAIAAAADDARKVARETPIGIGGKIFPADPRHKCLG